ncbi:MAG: hypothetical protein M3Q45_09030, partial [Chloroflexota bacterium]|nr:hypothetical protein [Chloroflexota bacterium]
GLSEPKVIAPVTPPDHDYVPPLSIFVYTHVVRPDQRDSYEFRSEHFSKVSRSLEEFEIDLSKLFPEEGAEPAAIIAPQKMAEEMSEEALAAMDNFSYDEDDAEA